MKKRLTLVACLLAVAGLIFGASWGPTSAAATVPGTNQLIDISASGTAPNSYAIFLSSHLISSDGKYVAFVSHATNIVSGGTSAVDHVYVRNTATGLATLVDVSTAGVEGNYNAEVKAITSDGRYILFNSMSTNLIDGFTFPPPLMYRTYIRDTLNNTTTKVNASGNSISSDAKYLLITSTGVPGYASNGKKQVFIGDLQNNQWRLVSSDSSGNLGNKDSTGFSMSCSGNVVAFKSGATNLPGNSGVTGSNVNLFVGIVGWNGIENLVNVTQSTLGTTIGSAQVSCSGNDVVYDTDVVSGRGTHTYKYNRLTGAVAEVGKNSVGTSITSRFPSTSSDGRYVAFTSPTSGVDPNYTDVNASGYDDIYIRDTKNNTTQLVTFNTLGSRIGNTTGAVSISADGSRVAYQYKTPSSDVLALELIPGVYNPNAGEDVYASETGF